MRNPSLYQEIEKDLKTIAKRLFAEDDLLFEEKWREVKTHIRELADYAKALKEEDQRRDREKQ